MADPSDIARSGAVPWEVYMQSHLVHESQIAKNTQSIADMLKVQIDYKMSLSDMMRKIDETNTKLTDHITDENKTWVEVRADLKIINGKVTNPAISLKTLGAFLIAIVAISGTVATILHYFVYAHGP